MRRWRRWQRWNIRAHPRRMYPRRGHLRPISPRPISPMWCVASSTSSSASVRVWSHARDCETVRPSVPGCGAGTSTRTRPPVPLVSPVARVVRPCVHHSLRCDSSSCDLLFINTRGWNLSLSDDERQPNPLCLSGPSLDAKQPCKGGRGCSTASERSGTKEAREAHPSCKYP